MRRSVDCCLPAGVSLGLGAAQGMVNAGVGGAGSGRHEWSRGENM